MAEKVIRIVGLVNGQPSSADGAYIESWDELNEQLNVTDDVERALRFPHAGAAITFWKTPSILQPIRTDNKVNRPMTVYTVEVLNAPTPQEVATNDRSDAES